MKDEELFDSFIIEFTFFIFYKLFERPKYSILGVQINSVRFFVIKNAFISK